MNIRGEKVMTIKTERKSKHVDKRHGEKSREW